MTGDSIFRRLRGTLGNALVWGVGWFACALAVFAAQRILGIAPASDSWVGALQSAAKFGVMGAIAGAAFFTFVTLRYHGRRISEIGWVRFGIGGGVFAGLFVPAFIVVARLLSGEGFLPLQNLLANGLVAGVLGAVAAGGSLKLTQLAGALFPGRSQD